MSRGYTKIDNQDIYNLYNSDLTAAEIKIMLMVYRYTNGFNRDSHNMATSFIANGINAHKSTVIRSIKSLEKKGLISVKYNGTKPKEICLTSSTDATSTSSTDATSTSSTDATKLVAPMRHKKERIKERTNHSSPSVLNDCPKKYERDSDQEFNQEIEKDWREIDFDD